MLAWPEAKAINTRWLVQVAGKTLYLWWIVKLYVWNPYNSYSYMILFMQCLRKICFQVPICSQGPGYFQVSLLFKLQVLFKSQVSFKLQAGNTDLNVEASFRRSARRSQYPLRRTLGLLFTITTLGTMPALPATALANDNQSADAREMTGDTSEAGLLDRTPQSQMTVAELPSNSQAPDLPSDQLETFHPAASADISLVPQAQSVDLSEPVEQADYPIASTPGDSVLAGPVHVTKNPDPGNPDTTNSDTTNPDSKHTDTRKTDTTELVPEVIVDSEQHGEPLIILGAKVPPGTSTRLSWKPDQSFEGIAAPTPVLVVNGAQSGPTLCLTAAIHGDELNGIEMVRRILYETEPEKLHGTLIGVPIVNLHGFHRTSRYLPDRRDLNRYFPGNPRGSSAARIAYSFFNEIIRHCDALVDLHTGSFHRTNLPQVRADLTDAAIVDLSQSFGATVVLHNTGTQGTLRRAAADAGIPAITLEAGEPMRVQQAAVNHGVKGIETLLNKLAMYKRIRFWGDPEPVFYHSQWIRAEQGGILFSEVELGENVSIGELLGTVTDPITNVRTEIQSPFKGRVLGRALDQVVMPGFAAFRIGIETSEQDVLQEKSDTGDAVDDGEGPELEAAKIMRKARALDTSREQEKDDILEMSE